MPLEWRNQFWPNLEEGAAPESEVNMVLNVHGTGPLCCFTSTEARWLIRDGDGGGGGGGGGDERVKARPWIPPEKRAERPWTAARTMEVLRRCPLAIAQRLVHCAIAVSLPCFGRVTRTMSVALLLRNNSKRKKSNFRSPAPPSYS